jgi:membrane-bound metal-dependent hydrolase YbcI (DUF457 family)
MVSALRRTSGLDIHFTT